MKCIGDPLNSLWLKDNVLHITYITSETMENDLIVKQFKTSVA